MLVRNASVRGEQVHTLGLHMVAMGAGGVPLPIGTLTIPFHTLRITDE